jgi:hypothetical protein
MNFPGLASSDASPPRTYASIVASLSPIAYWRKPVVAAWPDASGNGYDATLVGLPPIVAGIAGASADGAVSLDGSTQYGRGPLVPQGNYFSLVAWIKGESITGGHVASNRDDAAVGGFDWYLIGSPNGDEIYTPGGNYFAKYMASGSLNDGAWHMLAYTTAADAAKTYIDGALCGEVTAANTGVATCGLNLGATTPVYGAVDKLHGILAQVSIHSSILTLVQIAQLWAAGIAA